MTIEQKIFTKLEPHAKRIQDGNGNDFDYLPAVLLQLIEGQKRQATQIENAAKHLDSLQSRTVAVGLQTKEEIAAFDSATQSKLQQLGTALQDAQIQLQSSQASIKQEIAFFSKSHGLHAVQTAEGLSAIGSQIKLFVDDTQQAHVKILRFLIAGLVTSTVLLGLAIVILQRH